MGGPFVSTLLELLDSQVGVKEDGGPNAGMPLMRYGLKGEAPAPWCARFVRWAFSECGRPLVGNAWKLGAVAYMREQCEASGWMVQGMPQPGDIVFFRTRIGSDAGKGHHVGIVTATDGHLFQTVEGNSGDAVKRRRYAITEPAVWGFARAPGPA